MSRIWRVLFPRDHEELLSGDWRRSSVASSMLIYYVYVGESHG